MTTVKTNKKATLTIHKNSMGYVVYNAKTKDGIDVFPDDTEGRERFVEFLSSNGVSKPEQYLK